LAGQTEKGKKTKKGLLSIRGKKNFGATKRKGIWGGRLRFGGTSPTREGFRFSRRKKSLLGGRGGGILASRERSGAKEILTAEKEKTKKSNNTPRRKKEEGRVPSLKKKKALEMEAQKGKNRITGKKKERSIKGTQRPTEKHEPALSWIQGGATLP